jgi:hypothetical protein
MTPERFRQIEEVVEAAADAPAGERDAVLDRLCRDDPALRAEVEALLTASPDATPRTRGASGRVADEVSLGATVSGRGSPAPAPPGGAAWE